MDYKNISQRIINWLSEKLDESGCEGFVIGVSGGVDSAVTSTLCAKTGKNLIVLNMPIHQEEGQLGRSDNHIKWLKDNYSNVESFKVNLSDAFDSFQNSLNLEAKNGNSLANSRSRMRMMTLYAYANSKNYLVVGTGNKVEDYGIGFFTKYGDGGVDLSPIADLLKTEVYQLSKFLKINKEIQEAKPTDGLWGDNRTDEDQIGASYEELEWALSFHDSKKSEKGLNDRQKEVLNIYRARHYSNQHKLKVPPTFLITEK